MVAERHAALGRWLLALWLLVAPALALVGTPAHAHPGHHVAVAASQPRAAGASLATAWARPGLPPIAVAGSHCPGESGGCGCHLDGCPGHSEPRILLATSRHVAYPCVARFTRVVAIAKETPRPQPAALALKRTRAPPLL
jgi:hypothetical protein